MVTVVSSNKHQYGCTRIVVDKDIKEENKMWKRREKEIYRDIQNRRGSILPGELTELMEHDTLNQQRYLK
jgi:hypothetical protein